MDNQVSPFGFMEAYAEARGLSSEQAVKKLVQHYNDDIVLRHYFKSCSPLWKALAKHILDGEAELIPHCDDEPVSCPASGTVHLERVEINHYHDYLVFKFSIEYANEYTCSSYVKDYTLWVPVGLEEHYSDEAFNEWVATHKKKARDSKEKAITRALDEYAKEGHRSVIESWLKNNNPGT